jgi:signal peptidase II
MKNRYLLISILVLIADLFSKWVVRLKLDETHPVEIIPGYLRLSSACNSGVAFGFFNGVESIWKPYVLAAMAIAAIVIIVIYSARMPQDRKLLHVALAITTGGILGNFIDRIARGCVIDFIDFHIHEAFYWPTFNVADSAITIGIALLLIDAIVNPSKKGIPEQSPRDNQS